MRLSPLIAVIAALIAAVIVGGVAVFAIQPPHPLLYNVSLSPTAITPGSPSNGAAVLSYTLNHNAQITLSFSNKTDSTKTYRFRQNEPRSAGDYRVNFSGIVDGFTLPGESIDGQVIDRLLPNGAYTWTLAATDEAAKTTQVSGSLTVNSPDSALPLIQNFSVAPSVFTPNQDGIDDRVAINVYLAKPATLSVYLQGADGTRYDVAERIAGHQPGEAGAHIYDYDGGIDNNVTPPPNGAYTVIAEAQDREGQLIRRTTAVTIKDGGLPLAEIQPQTAGNALTWGIVPFTSQATVSAPSGVTATQAAITLKQGDLLSFSLYVHNYGTTPIRTIGPWPGAVYDFPQTDSIFTNTEPASRSGAWRVGLYCETAQISLPWRWAIGTKDQLTTATDNKGDTFYYLGPGKSALVWGAVRMSTLIATRNPQQCYATLIHEDVATFQSGLGEIGVTLTPGS